MFIFIVSDIPDVQCAIKCYKCLVAPPIYYTNESILLCKDFDNSEKFIVNCPDSTFCKKNIFSAKIPGKLQIILIYRNIYSHWNNVGLFTDGSVRNSSV